MSTNQAPQNDESQNVARIEWDGEGLPPIGLRVEWESDTFGWLGGKVVGHDQSVTIVRHNDGYVGCHPHKVRPIRTAEQAAEEKRHKETHEWLEKISIDYGLATSVECYKILLAAGLRRP